MTGIPCGIPVIFIYHGTRTPARSPANPSASHDDQIDSGLLDQPAVLLRNTVVCNDAVDPLHRTYPAETAPPEFRRVGQHDRIVAEADRVIDCETTLRRTVQYGLEHAPELDREGQFARFAEHLRTKYGEGGYLRLWLPESENASRLDELRAVIRDDRQLRVRFDELYDDELRREA